MSSPYPADTVYFYGATDPYSEFSHFAPYGIAMGGVWWRTVEHWFQAQKFHDATWRERIRSTGRPRQAKALGLTREVPLRADWEDVKDGLMHQAVTEKFRTHQALAELLLSTGDRTIVENSPYDGYWGCGADGTGLNRLGVILMAVRSELARDAS